MAATGCNNKKPAEYTMLGEYTPYSNIHEKLYGKVEKVIQKFYWAIPDGEKFTKGKLVTDHERDSLGLMRDFGVLFDNSGDVVNSYSFNENGKIIGRWDLIKENNVLTIARRTNMDTLSIYHKLKCNSDGEVTEAGRYMPVADTLISSYSIRYNMKHDTQTFQSYSYKGLPTTKRIAVADDDGQFLNVSFYNKDGSYTGGQDYNYKEKGTQTGLIYYDKNKKPYQQFNYYDIELDSHDNWIKIATKGKTGPAFIAERTFTYFN